ncbi:MAG: S9 family peptidase [Planctomycetaceae bacterium]|nr:S9 family peptidase [Planctomycetaceae bacterium]
MSRMPALGLLLIALLPASLAAQAPVDPRRPNSIKVEEVPVVPSEIFARLREYQNIRNAQFASWSPDGQNMLVITRFGNAAQLHRVYEPGGRREQITFFDEPVMSGRFLPQTDAESLLFVMSQGGNENDQIHRLEPRAFRHQLLTDGKSRHQLGPVSRDGTKMLLHHNARNGRDTDLYIADTATGKQELIYETTNEYWQVEDWSSDGRWLLMSRYVSINEGYPALFDVREKKRIDITLAKDKSQKVAIGEMKFSADGKSAYLTHDADGEFLQLVRYDLDSKQYQSLTTTIPWDVSGVEVDKTSGAVAFTINEDGYSGLYLYRFGKLEVVDIPRGLISNVKFSPDGKRLGFTWASPAAQADTYSYDLSDRKLTRWTFSETGGLDTAKFVTPELIRFKSFDDREVSAFYYRPKGASDAKPAGVLIGIHGGPESQYRPDFSGLAQFYAGELNIAVIFPNVRGSAGYGKTYLQLDNGMLRENSVKDIGALLDWIGGRKELDAKRVAVTGGSYGGYMVLASLVHFGDRIRAGIDIVGIANWVTFLERTSPYRQDLRRAEYGDERIPEMRAFMDKISPTSQAEKIKSALLVAHGVNDPRVPFSEAKQIAEKVRSAGRPVWTVYADNEGHGFQKKDNRDYLSGVEAMYLLKHLGDNAEPAGK